MGLVELGHIALHKDLNSLAWDDQKTKVMISYSQVLYHIFHLQGMQLTTNSSTLASYMIVELASF